MWRLPNSARCCPHQKISDTEGDVTGILENGDHFGASVASLGDLDGDGVSDLDEGVWRVSDGGTDHGGVSVLFLDGGPAFLADCNDDGIVNTLGFWRFSMRTKLGTRGGCEWRQHAYTLDFITFLHEYVDGG